MTKKREKIVFEAIDSAIDWAVDRHPYKNYPDISNLDEMITDMEYQINALKRQVKSRDKIISRLRADKIKESK